MECLVASRDLVLGSVTIILLCIQKTIAENVGLVITYY